VKKYYIKDIQNFKKNNQRFATITAYDYTSSSICNSLGFPLLLVGDSSSMVVFGYEDTTRVTMEEMLFLLRAVIRGNSSSVVVADMPFLSYQPSKRDAIHNAGQFIKAGANAVKLEGGREVLETVEGLVKSGIPVMGHLGLLPQSINLTSGYRVQGKTKGRALELIEEAVLLQKAGAFSLVLEGVPKEVAKIITERVKIPTVGIGSGPDCDGQIQVFHDVLGLFNKIVPRHTKNFIDGSKHLIGGLKKYKDSVEAGIFPGSANYSTLSPNVLKELSESI
tara:strand:- start:43 stop:879 length:837 start_codon:yes stop_codon:yes gene_type:complete